MEILSILTFAAALCAVAMQIKRDLMMLQQNSYRNDRYNHWLSESGESTRYNRLGGFSLFFFSLIPAVPTILSLPLICLFSVWMFVKLLTAKYKKPLVFTNRAKRIYLVSILIVLAVLAAVVFSQQRTVTSAFSIAAIFSMLIYSGSECVVMLANWLLQPVEKSINRKYYNQAAQIMKSMPELKVIGITGSYGKTSTKHYLNAILSEHFDVLMTPGNFNTTLGVIRTIREHLKPYNQIFIAEMGAKQSGDIKEICDLVHPTIGIITSVGPQHLESFKTIENVQATKFELADAIPQDGLVVVNNDFEFIANRQVDNAKCIRYTADNNPAAAFSATDVTYSARGTDFTIQKDGKPVISLHTKLIGQCNISNLVAAVIVAMELGVPQEKIRYAVERIQQVEHRLSLKHTPAGINIIDDAYNSNPVGSKMALDVLAGMDSGKRIVITPGMIELGDDQEQLNHEFGVNIASSADIAIIVGEYNRQSIVSGIEQAISEGHSILKRDDIHVVDTFDHAQQMLMTIAKTGDTVLYENDLPDTFK